ncbi:MAG: tetratricopeptide repeat protein [Myxococcota bacterium]
MADLVPQSKEKSLQSLIQGWAEGKTTLKEIKGYSDSELYAIAHQGYFFLLQGKNEEAKTIFEGLVAIDPRNDYYYRALGVIYHKLGDPDRAIKQFTYASRVAPSNLAAFINRAEVYVATGKRKEALADLDHACNIARDPESPLARKARALAEYLRRK